ncbi:MAG: hypothetical protein ABIK89_04735, partial [Planctomycetota bacterium]
APAENRAMLPAVADLAALKALTAAQRADMSLVVVDTLGVYKFDGASAAAGDDYQVVVPTVGTGRWLLQVPLSTPLNVAAPVADLATAKALPVAALASNSLLWIKTLGLYWLDSTSAAAADDVNVIQLTAEVGNARLIRLVPTAEPRAVHAPIADLAALKALAETDRADNMVVFVDALGVYRFIAAGGVGTADDYQIVDPTAGTGQWVLEAEALKPLKVASSVADLAAAKALPVAALHDTSLLWIETLGLYWLDATSAAAADDQTVIQLTAEVGNARLIRVAPASIPRAWHEPLADLAALKAVAEADRADNMLVLVDTLGVYQFDAAGSATGDDDAVVQPTAGTGRWMMRSRITQGPYGIHCVDLPCTVLDAAVNSLGALHATKSCTIFDAKFVVRVAPTGGTATVQGGITTNEDGLLVDISTAVPGVIPGAAAWTNGVNATYLSANTVGEFLADATIGGDAVTTLGHFRPLTYTLAAGVALAYKFPDAQTSTDISLRVFYCVNPSV